MKADRVFIIAEAGVNHNGRIETARRMVDIAADAGADAIKFQTFSAVKEISRYAPKAAYQAKTTPVRESQLEMARKLELNESDHRKLIARCSERKILFLSSPFDLASIDMLNSLGLRILKIPSGEITNLPYLKKIGALKKRLILSTGMSDLKEISRALDILIESGTSKNAITVLHCNTEYPTPYKDANLRAMLSMKEAFDVTVGYSDHTAGIEIALAAVALGARIVEKHFTMDRRMKGPDHIASLEPDEFALMVRSIRNIEKAMGDSIKRPSKSELKNILIARKSIVASRNINKGELFTEENITVKRPGTGISPMEWYAVLGKIAGSAFKEDEVIRI